MRRVAIFVVLSLSASAGVAWGSGKAHRALPRLRPATHLLFGDRTVGHATRQSRPGIAQAFRFVDRSSGRISAISVYVGSPARASRLFVGIYSNGRHAPGTRLTSGSLARPRGRAWNLVHVRRASLSAGKVYWLAVLGEQRTLRFRAHTARSCMSVSSLRHRLSRLPARWQGGRRGDVCLISAFAKGISTRLHGSPAPPGGPPAGKPPTGKPVSPVAPAPPVGPGVPVRPSCTTTVSSTSAASAAVASAPGGAAICLAPGSYIGLNLSGAHSANVTVESEPGLDPNGAGRVTIGLSSTLTDGFGNPVAANVAPNSSNIVLLDLYFTNELSIAHGSTNIVVDHNDFSQVGNGGGEMINFATSDCTAPNAPSWSGCSPEDPVSNVTITGNNFHGIDSQGDDVLHTNNFRNLTITANEISGAVENNAGGHVDCLQNVFGGQGLVFADNYEHDNECQGFFLKDGDITNVTFDDNLFLRDELPATNGGSSQSSSQVYNTANFVAQNNTIWDGKGLTLRCASSSVGCTAQINHNLIWVFNNGNRGDPTVFNLNEGFNVFESMGFGAGGANDQVTPHPAFMCGSRCGDGTVAGDDYRLAANPSHVGITWAPSQYVYGPA